jgi:dTDP-4-dehydrorhamnose reductase
MRCLILGATGQIGANLISTCELRGLARLGTWYSFPYAEHVPLDVRDADSVEELVADYQPDATFLTAGISCSGYAEAFPVETQDVVVGGTQIVADAVARHGGMLITFSTDEVFGSSLTAHREEDPVSPVGALARSHVDAERIVRLLLPNRHLIIRTGWVFGPEERGRNLVCRLVRELSQGNKLFTALDRHGQPTYGPDLAALAIELAHRGQTGTIHVVGPDRHTEFTFARLAAHILGYDVDRVTGCDAAILDDDRPSRGRVWLDRHAMRAILGAKAIRGTADGLRAFRTAPTPAIRGLRAA